MTIFDDSIHGLLYKEVQVLLKKDQGKARWFLVLKIIWIVLFEKKYLRFLFDISNGTLKFNRQPLDKANL